MFQLAFAVEFW